MAVPTYEVFDLRASGVASVAFSPDQKRIYAALRDGNVQVYDVATHSLVATWDVGQMLGGISVSEDGAFLLVADTQFDQGSSTVYRVDTATGAVQAYSFTSQYPFRDVEIVDSDTALITSYYYGGTSRLNLQTGALSPLPNSPTSYSVMVEDGRYTLLALTGTSDGPLYLYDDQADSIVAQGDNYQTIPTTNTTGYNWGGQAVSEEAGLVLQFVYYGSVNVFDLSLKFKYNINLGGRVDGIAFDDSGTYAYFFLIDSGVVAKYAVATWTLVQQMTVGTSSWHNSHGFGSQLLVSKDGRYATVNDADSNRGKLQLVDFAGGDETLAGTPGADVIDGLGGNDVIDTGAGNDRLDGGTGSDILRGGADDDVYVVDNAGDAVEEGPGGGIDEVRTSLAAYSLLGGEVENLTATSDSSHDFRGSSAANVITGGGGNDFLRLQDGGADTANGGAGNDVFLFGAAFGPADVVDGGPGTDQIAIQGDYSGARALALGSLIVSVENFAILPGDDTRFGDPGTNFYSYEISSLDSAVAAGVQLVVDANRLRPGENLTFNGSTEADGSFFIYGGSGVDRLTGGARNDVFIFGHQGQWGTGDIVTGGAGTDQLALRGNYTITFGANQLVGIEQIGMVSAQDTRYGALGSSYSYDLTMVDSNVDSIQMTVDAAPIRPGETLTFNGSAEDDGSFRVFGGRGDDILTGSQNGDILAGNAGADDLTGGAGGDAFRYVATSDSAPGAEDHILDFTPGSDWIDLTRIDADSHAAGNQAFRWIGSNAFSGTNAASAGELRAYQSGNSWFVEGDTDGNGAADLVIELTVLGPTPLGADHFLL